MFKSVGLPKKVQDAADYSWQNNKAKPAELNIPIQSLGWGYHSSPKQRQKSAKEVMDLLDYCAKVKCKLIAEYRASSGWNDFGGECTSIKGSRAEIKKKMDFRGLILKII